MEKAQLKVAFCSLAYVAEMTETRDVSSVFVAKTLSCTSAPSSSCNSPRAGNSSKEEPSFPFPSRQVSATDLLKRYFPSSSLKPQACPERNKDGESSSEPTKRQAFQKVKVYPRSRSSGHSGSPQRSPSPTTSSSSQVGSKAASTSSVFGQRERSVTDPALPALSPPSSQDVVGMRQKTVQPGMARIIHEHDDPRAKRRSLRRSVKISIDEDVTWQRVLTVDAELKWSGVAANFNILEKIGVGAYGTVWKAELPTTGAIIAVKKMNHMKSQELQSVQEEIAILKQCRHPNIVSYNGCCVKDGRLWIMMELCGAGSVADILKHQALSENEVATILCYTFRGLAYVHSQGVVHGDLKAANILVTESGEVKLADFGVASRVDAKRRKGQVEGDIPGTVLFSPPEVISGSSIQGHECKIDIWSMGITTIEMVDR